MVRASWDRRARPRSARPTRRRNPCCCCRRKPAAGPGCFRASGPPPMPLGTGTGGGTGLPGGTKYFRTFMFLTIHLCLPADPSAHTNSSAFSIILCRRPGAIQGHLLHEPPGTDSIPSRRASQTFQFCRVCIAHRFSLEPRNTRTMRKRPSHAETLGRREAVKVKPAA